MQESKDNKNNEVTNALTIVHAIVNFANDIAGNIVNLKEKAGVGVDLRPYMKEFGINTNYIIENPIMDHPIVLLGQDHEPMHQDRVRMVFLRSGQASTNNDGDVYCFQIFDIIICIGDVIVISWPDGPIIVVDI